MAICPTCRKRYPDDVQVCEVDGETLLPNEAFTGVDVELSPGRMVGEYRIEGKLGEGGFGAVYKAVHPLIGKTAAVKVLNRQYSANPQMVSRFIAEARAVNQIRHRNIIDIFAFGALEDGRQYFIMELLQGMPLDKYLEQKGHLSVEEAVAVLRPVARALDAAHAAGIAHRDLKPENIFLSFDDDGAPFPKLLDFGIAKLMTPEATGAHPASGDPRRGPSVKTRTGTPMGTPYYMSPEQCRGRNVDHRTDVYSFGIMLHQVLAGRLPIDGDDLMDLLIKQSTMPAPPLSSMAPHLSAALDAPILSMLEKEPDKRPPSVGAAMEAFIGSAQRAGFSVHPAAPGSNAGRPAFVAGGLQSGSDLTPSQKMGIGVAKTMKTPGPIQTFQGANVDVVPSPKRRSALPFVVAPIALVAGAAIVVVAMRKPAPAAAPTATPATSVVDAPPPRSSASATAPDLVLVPTAPAAAPDVSITVNTTPKNAGIYLDGERIGTAPGPVKIKRSAGSVKLAVKEDGYAPKTLDVTTDTDQTLTVNLARIGGKPAPVGPKRDYDTPKEFQ
jgi:serine/threonine-protein kinase